MSLRFKAASERRIREHNDRVEQAWITARLNAYAPAKPDKFPKLESLLAKSEPKVGPKQTAEQQIAVLQAVMANRRR